MKANLKKRGVVAGLVGALVLALAVIGFSQEGGRPQGPPPGGGFHRGPGGPGRDGLGPIGRDLNLTDEQKAQIQKINAAFEESTRALRDQLRTLHESQPDPLKGGAFDEAAVRAAAEARAKIEVELEVAHARQMSQVFALLTDEQKAQLAARREQFGRRRGPGGPPREGDAPNN